jgi:hypothetical protein
MCHIEISISESNLVPHKSLMYHDIQKFIFYHTFHLFFPIRHACGHVDVSTPSFGSHLQPIPTRGAGRLYPPYLQGVSCDRFLRRTLAPSTSRSRFARTRATAHRTCACAHAPSQLIPCKFY